LSSCIFELKNKYINIIAFYLVLITFFIGFTSDKHENIKNCSTIAKSDKVLVDSVNNLYFNRGFLHVNNQLCIRGLYQNTIFIQDNLQEVRLDRIKTPFRLMKNKNCDTLFIYKNGKIFKHKIQFLED